MGRGRAAMSGSRRRKDYESMYLDLRDRHRELKSKANEQSDVIKR